MHDHGVQNVDRDSSTQGFLPTPWCVYTSLTLTDYFSVFLCSNRITTVMAFIHGMIFSRISQKSKIKSRIFTKIVIHEILIP